MNQSRVQRPGWIFLLFVSAAIVVLSFGVSSAAFEGGNQEPDDLLQDYIDSHIPDTALLLQSSFLTDYTQISEAGKEGINDKFRTSVYTYKSEDIVYTVISLESLAEIKISAEDFLDVDTNAYLRPVSPASAVLYTRNADENWSYQKDVEAIVNMSRISIYGGELTNEHRYMRLLLRFTSYENAQAEETRPYFGIHFFNYVKGTNRVLMAVLCALVLMAVGAGILLYRRRRRQQRKSGK